MKWPLIVGLTIVHLGVLAVGIFDPRTENASVGFARNAYFAVTGAGGSFGFFSPDVGNQILIHFITDKNEEIRLHEQVSGEAAVRIGNMYRLFIESFKKDELKRSVAASLTAQIFRRKPDAKRITMVASIYRFPSLIEWSKAARPQTKEIYRVTFTRAAADAE